MAFEQLFQAFRVQGLQGWRKRGEGTSIYLLNTYPVPGTGDFIKSISFNSFSEWPVMLMCSFGFEICLLWAQEG